MTGHNNVIRLLARGVALPEGWGFPPLAREAPSDLQLRKVLMFLDDQDGAAQLIRWYHGILQAAPHVWRSLAGTEGYMPSFTHLPAIWSPTLSFVRSPNSGAMLLRWNPGAGVKSLSGKLTLSSPAVLELDGQTYDIPLVEHADSGITSIGWPEFLKCEAGLQSYTPDTIHFIYFRPPRFDHQWIVDTVFEQEAELHRAGLLDSFLSLPRPEDKIAVAWLAVARLESPE